MAWRTWYARKTKQTYAMSSYKTEIEVLTSYKSSQPKYRYRRGVLGVVFVHQNNSDLAAGLTMLGYKVIKATAKDVIGQAVSVAKNHADIGISAYIIDSYTLDGGVMQAPFSAIGYIRVYDKSTPVIALSYDTNVDSVKAAFRYGATCYLTRPQPLDLVAAVLEGVIANNEVLDSAQAKLEAMSQNRSRKLVKLSDSLFLDYANQRLAFLDMDGVFTFSNKIASHICNVIHCLAMNMGRRLSGTAIARLMGELDDKETSQALKKKAADRVNQALGSVRRLIRENDHYKTIQVSNDRRHGIMITATKPTIEAIESWKQEKEEQELKDSSKVRAGFSLVELMEQNDTDKSKENELEDML